MAQPEPPPAWEDVWPPPPQGQEHALPSPKTRPHLGVFSVLKYGLGFGVGFCLCAVCALFGLGLTYSASPPGSVSWLETTTLVVAGVVVAGLLCQWFRLYYRSFGLWMLLGVYAAGVVSVLLLCLHFAFPDLFSRIFVPRVLAV